MKNNEEFIQYSAGFMNGVAEARSAVRETEFQPVAERYGGDLYFKGHEDGFNYLMELVKENGLDLSSVNLKPIIEEKFDERVNDSKINL